MLLDKNARRKLMVFSFRISFIVVKTTKSTLYVVVVSLEGPCDARVRTGVKKKNRPPHFCLTLIRPRAESTNQINIKLVMIRACKGSRLKLVEIKEQEAGKRSTRR